MSRIAVAGATGFVGTALTLKLLDQGHEVVALSRKPQSWPLQHQNLKVIKGNVLEEKTLDEFLTNVDCAYYLVHALSAPLEDFEFLEAKEASVFAKAAHKHKLKKIIYLGGLGPDHDLSAHLRSRHLAGEILGLSNVPTIEFRASIILGANSTSFEMIKALVQRLPVRPYTPWLETLCQPIGEADLIRYLIAALDVKCIGRQVIEIGGREAIAYGDLLDLYIKLEEVQRPKVLLPKIEQRLLLPIFDLVIPEFAEVGKKLFLSLEYPTVVTDQISQELFPDIVPMSISEAMELAFKESSTSYPAVWEGDFWKEMMDQTLLHSKQGQVALLQKLKHLAEISHQKKNPLSALSKMKELKSLFKKKTKIKKAKAAE